MRGTAKADLSMMRLLILSVAKVLTGSCLSDGVCPVQYNLHISCSLLSFYR